MHFPVQRSGRNILVSIDDKRMWIEAVNTHTHTNATVGNQNPYNEINKKKGKINFYSDKIFGFITYTHT